MSIAAPIPLTATIVCMVCIGICHGAGLTVLLTLRRMQGKGYKNEVAEARNTSAALLAVLLALMISGTMEESMGYTAFFATILCVCTALSATTYLLTQKTDERKDGE